MKRNIENCVIESRVWLLRNLKDYPFPTVMTKEVADKLISELKHAFQGEKVQSMYHLSWHLGMDVGYAEQLMLHLKYGFSHKKYEDGHYQLVEDPTKKLMIFVCADDHLRIQKHASGLVLEKIWEEISALDDQLDSALEYAFDPELGYLTSHVTDVGTAIHASVLIHLPALTETGYIEWVNQAASQLGLTVTGIHDKYEKGTGGLYRIENHVTLGRSEWEIVDTITEVVRQISIKENDALETLIVSKRLELEDRISRSLGILSNARLIDHEEVLEHLSHVRMGIRAGLIKNIDVEKLDQLIYDTDTGILQLQSGKIMNALELRAHRADLCRTFFLKEA